MSNSLDHKEALWQQRRVMPIAVLHLSFFLALQILSTSTVVAFRAIAGHVDATHASHFHGSCMLVMRGGFQGRLATQLLQLCRHMEQGVLRAQLSLLSSRNGGDCLMLESRFRGFLGSSLKAAYYKSACKSILTLACKKIYKEVIWSCIFRKNNISQLVNHTLC